MLVLLQVRAMIEQVTRIREAEYTVGCSHGAEEGRV